ncbi:MAG: hypothetical protein KF909_12715 [Rhodocyclaceae bacterium]|uniref:hypothetical protein n=1 Tax=Cognatazoarcus halotolerans TaxID=2686016 RepID=UPI001357E105|nr:hypothetical protein [Cognatazoarcus halotolerans]MBX3686995.1 hypothetical protein [Rhodocyclaceae bacterium]
MTLHLELRDAIEARYGDALQGPVELHQDAIRLRLGNGVEMEVRFAAEDAYSIRWTSGRDELCIDTAPRPDLQPALPSHLHDHRGQVRPDPITRPGLAPIENLSSLINALLISPTLEGRGH